MSSDVESTRKPTSDSDQLNTASEVPGPATTVEQLVSQVLDGNTQALARLITLVEDESPFARRALALLAERPGRAHVVGLTGAPGVGKSTSTSALIAAFRSRGMAVAALMIDPSSSLSGGALLGDRVRMADFSADRGVFVRSMASRGRLGGLSWTAPQAVRVLSAAGYDIILLETVGVGQAEIDVAWLADTTLVLLAPGMGDGIQAAKAGVLELADVFVVNKADRDGAHAVVRDIRQAVSLRHREIPWWRPPIIETVAVRSQGADEVLDAVLEHRDWLLATGRDEKGRLERVAREVEALSLSTLDRRFMQMREGGAIVRVAERVLCGELDPYTASDRLLKDLMIDVP